MQIAYYCSVKMKKELFQIASRLFKGVGDVSIRALISYLGDVEAIFTAKQAELANVPGIDNKAKLIVKYRDMILESAQKELDFVEKYKLQMLFFTEPNYPLRLKECNDAPLLLYYRGKADLNAAKAISIVGTRHSTDYGAERTESFLKELAQYHPDVLILSGLAYGIDVLAHRDAMKYNLPTVGVLAHGLDRVYPATHKTLAKRMLSNGGLLTEFDHGKEPARENFVKRNRIVAGLSEATVVIESAVRGGSLITATIASSYNRKVMAVPGRIGDLQSVGCNNLIKTNRAGLLENVEDLEYLLGWTRGEAIRSGHQTQLMLELNNQEQAIYDFLRKKQERCHINAISIANKIPMSQLNSILINMEFNGLIRCFPGNMYQLC